MANILTVGLLQGCSIGQFGLKQLWRTRHPNANAFNIQQNSFRICGIWKAANGVKDFNFEFASVHFQNNSTDNRRPWRRYFHLPTKPGVQCVKQRSRSEQIQVFAREWLELEQFGGDPRKKEHRPRIYGVTAHDKRRLPLYDGANDFSKIAKDCGFRHNAEPLIPVINPLQVSGQIDNTDRCALGNQSVFLLNLFWRCQPQCNATGILGAFLPVLVFNLFKSDHGRTHHLLLYIAGTLSQAGRTATHPAKFR